MAKRIPLSLCLLSGVIFAGVPAQAALTPVSTASQTLAIAQQGITATIYQIAVQQTASAQATLTVEDLPPGFTQLPPEIAAQISSQLDFFRQQLGQGTLKPENFFAFVNQRDYQIVLGFTGSLPDQPGQANFDSTLQQLQEPEVRELLLSQLRERLKAFGEVKVTAYEPIPDLNNVANASTGITLGLEMQGRPLRMDMAAFRRDAVGAFTAVMYANGGQPVVGVGDVARKLDGRIVQLSSQTETHRSPLAKVQ